MNKTKHVTARVTEEDFTTLKSICDAEGVSVSDLMRQSIRSMSGPRSDNSEWE